MVWQTLLGRVLPFIAMIRTVAISLLTFAAAACGGGSTTSTGSQATGLINGTFVATINGTAWSATGRVVVEPSTANTLLISATSSTYTIGLTIVGPVVGNSFSLQPQTGVLTSSAFLTNSGNTWTTSLPGATGTLLLTTYTSSRVAGTFSFTPLGAQGSPAASVTAGSFDVTY